MENEMKNILKEVKKPLFAGITLGLIALRFVPVYKFDAGFLGSAWFSLSGLVSACSVPGAGMFMKCGWVTFSNVLFWLALIFFAGSFLYTNRKLIVTTMKKYIKSLN